MPNVPMTPVEPLRGKQKLPLRGAQPDPGNNTPEDLRIEKALEASDAAEAAAKAKPKPKTPVGRQPNPRGNYRTFNDARGTR